MWWEGHSYSTALGVTRDPGCDQGIPPGLFKGQLRLAEAYRDVRPSLTPPPPRGTWGGRRPRGRGSARADWGVPPQPEVAAERRRRECARPSVPSAPPPGAAAARATDAPLSPPSWSQNSRGPGGGGLRRVLTLPCPPSFDPWDSGPLGDPPLSSRLSLGFFQYWVTDWGGGMRGHQQPQERHRMRPTNNKTIPGVYRVLMKTGACIRHLLHAAPGTPECSYCYSLSEEIEARTLGCGFQPCLLRVVLKFGTRAGPLCTPSSLQTQLLPPFPLPSAGPPRSVPSQG